ncbi:hypothetical protein F5884DRAFT_341614 [Xylogone sp. PMI_703]|nr:hypothetical protein F5884DRAFT_341614 [Xylogone sp. PMI_703]
MAEVGIMPPPAGVTPDFHSWTYVQHSVIGVFVSTFVIATIALVLRLYTAIILVRKVDWDIPFIILAWGTSLTFFIAMVIAMPSGFGRHLWDVTPTQLVGYFNLLLVLALTYIWPPTLTKLAMLALYVRINPSKLFQAGVWLTAIGIIAYTVVFTALFSGPCNPQSTGSGACLNNIAIAQAILNIVSDAAIIVLPIPTIHSLKMPLKQRLAIGILMGLGSAVVIASIARLAYVKAMVTNPDVTWTQASAAILSSLELNLGIICNSVSRMKPFVRKHFPSWASGFNSSGAPDYSRSKRNNGSYPLGSVERGERFGGVQRKDTANIHVTAEYQVDYEGKSVRNATGSTESILRPDV